MIDFANTLQRVETIQIFYKGKMPMGRNAVEGRFCSSQDKLGCSSELGELLPDSKCRFNGCNRKDPTIPYCKKERWISAMVRLI